MNIHGSNNFNLQTRNLPDLDTCEIKVKTQSLDKVVLARLLGMKGMLGLICSGCTTTDLSLRRDDG
jgi:hypothetical protein